MSIVEQQIAKLQDRIAILKTQERLAYASVQVTETASQKARSEWAPLYNDLVKLKAQLAALEEFAHEPQS